MSLAENQIGDEGCVALSKALPSLVHLNYIDLEDNQIGYEEKNKFRSLHGKKIEELFI